MSIDVDLEDSIYEGLRYFYPRLETGGYIFVHDYNGILAGVSTGIEKYEKEIKSSLHKFPICDNNGTLVITK